MPDRTRIAVQRQLAALNCPRYELLLRQWTGTKPDQYFMKHRQLIGADGLISLIRYLGRLNARNCDVFIIPRPATDQAGLVLVDDLDEVAVAALTADGVSPVVLLESSPANFQAWVRVPRRIRPLHAARALCRRYGADPGGSAMGISRVAWLDSPAVKSAAN